MVYFHVFVGHIYSQTRTAANIISISKKSSTTLFALCCCKGCEIIARFLFDWWSFFVILQKQSTLFIFLFLTSSVRRVPFLYLRPVKYPLFHLFIHFSFSFHIVLFIQQCTPHGIRVRLAATHIIGVWASFKAETALHASLAEEWFVKVSAAGAEIVKQGYEWTCWDDEVRSIKTQEGWSCFWILLQRWGRPSRDSKAADSWKAADVDGGKCLRFKGWSCRGPDEVFVFRSDGCCNFGVCRSLSPAHLKIGPEKDGDPFCEHEHANFLQEYRMLHC